MNNMTTDLMSTTPTRWKRFKNWLMAVLSQHFILRTRSGREIWTEDERNGKLS